MKASCKTLCDSEPHVTHLVHLLLNAPTARNRTPTLLLPSVEDIATIAELSSREDAIMIMEEEMEYLDDLSLEGDVPDDVSETMEVIKKGNFTGS